MTSKGPNRSRLQRNLINLFGIEKSLSLESLKRRVREVYGSISGSMVNLAVEEALLSLSNNGLVKIIADNQIQLTDAGKAKQKSIAASSEIRQKKKTQRKEAKLKKQEIEQRKKASKDVHDRVQSELGQLGFLLGRAWKSEHQLVKRGPVVLDLVWYETPHSTKISHAFEVQHRGDWKNAIHNLEAVTRRYGDCKLFLVVYNEKELSPIKNLLGLTLNTKIRVLGVPQVRSWINVLEGVGEQVRPRLIETVDDIRQSGIV